MTHGIPFGHESSLLWSGRTTVLGTLQDHSSGSKVHFQPNYRQVQWWVEEPMEQPPPPPKYRCHVSFQKKKSNEVWGGKKFLAGLLGLFPSGPMEGEVTTTILRAEKVPKPRSGVFGHERTVFNSIPPSIFRPSAHTKKWDPAIFMLVLTSPPP